MSAIFAITVTLFCTFNGDLTSGFTLACNPPALTLTSDAGITLTSDDGIQLVNQ